MDKIKPLATSRSRIDDARGARNFVRAEIGKLEGAQISSGFFFQRMSAAEGHRGVLVHSRPN